MPRPATWIPVLSAALTAIAASPWHAASANPFSNLPFSANKDAAPVLVQNLTSQVEGGWESGAHCSGLETKDLPRGYNLLSFVSNLKNPSNWKLVDVAVQVDPAEGGVATVSDLNPQAGTWTITSTCSTGFNNKTGQFDPMQLSQTVKYKITVTITEMR